jgi:hypothetical protein
MMGPEAASAAGRTDLVAASNRRDFFAKLRLNIRKTPEKGV